MIQLMMERRRFMALLAGGMLAVPITTEAQQAGKVWRVGYLTGNSKTVAAQVLQPFLEGMQSLGYVEERNLSCPSI